MPSLYGSDNSVLERTETKQEKKHPDMYNVIFYNDKYTHMDFVVDVLCEVFGYPEPYAIMIMFQIHSSGQGIVGTYPRDEAYAKADLVDALKAERNQPLVIDVKQA